MEEILDENGQIKIGFVTRGNNEPGNERPRNVEDNDGEDCDIRPFLSFRDKTLLVLHSYKFQIGVVALVILDCLLVIAEMQLDLNKEDHSQKHAAHALHYCSIGILSIFIVELGFKLYAYQLDFFHHKLEVFDAVVVLLSFAVDIVYINVESAAVAATGLVVLLRLWRIARILNGVLLSVKTQAEHKLSKEKQLRASLEQDRFTDQERIASLEAQIESLRKLLEDHGIPVPNNNF